MGAWVWRLNIYYVHWNEHNLYCNSREEWLGDTVTEIDLVDILAVHGIYLQDADTVSLLFRPAAANSIPRAGDLVKA